MKYSALAELAKGAKKMKAPRDDALALAQLRASLPVDQGGLGLPPGNTAMDRARAMGFTTDAYHGRSGDMANAELNADAIPAIYADLAPDFASKFAAMRGRQYGDASVFPLKISEGNVADISFDRPVTSHDMSDALGKKVLTRKANVGELSAEPWEWLQSHGNETNLPNIIRRNKIDAFKLYDSSNGENSLAVLNPANIRSRFAAFDPFRRNESDLLAGIAPYALPAAGAAGLAAMAAPGESEAGIAGVLAKTANRDMLKIAEQAEKQGLSMERIYDATGWARGADGKWKWEFDDSGAKLAHNANMLDRINKRGDSFVLDDLGNTLSHKNLYGAYPDASVVQVQHNLGGVPSGGAYNHAGDRITLEGSTLGHSTGEAKSTLLHETQHAIQQREGFARGGDPSMFTDDVALMKQAQADLSEINERIIANNWDRGSAKDPALSEQLAAEGASLRQKRDALKLDLTDPYRLKHKAYTRLAGEVEARNVQGRMDMAPDERRMRPFWQTEDVPRSQQIVQGSGDVADPLSALELNRRKRLANEQGMTHQPQRVPGAAEQAGRGFLSELFNPANWLPTTAGARELGRPEDLVYRNGEWVTQ